LEKRVIYSDNGVLSDFSTELNKYKSGTSTINLVAAQDYLYIGSRLPFNNLYIKMDTLNTNPSVMTVEYWDGDTWASVVELIDETSGFTSSGYITFAPDRNSSWTLDDTNYDTATITGLENITIYNMHWIRLSFSVNFSSGTKIQWLGTLLSEDNDLYAEFPDFSKTSVKTSFEAGKTSWEEQAVRASSLLVEDLIDNGIIIDAGQILIRSDYKNANVQKTAELIYSAFGDDFVDQKAAAQAEYKRRLDKKIHRVDKNNNAIEDQVEIKNESGFLKR
jgi:hypothetical protein